MNKNTAILIVAIIVIAGAIYFLESKKAGGPSLNDLGGGIIELAMDNEEKAKKFEKAREIVSPSGFVNTEALTIQELIGKKVILVDFWTYSCINCQRTLPHLRSWYEKYGDKGLEIVGIHTPEFEFEKDIGNVRKAVEKWGLEYPVVLDNNYATWNAYKNRYWPRKYLIDIDGFVVYDHIGEGAYDETESKIVELLNERARKVGNEANILVSGEGPAGLDSVNASLIRTPETYLGSLREEHLANLPRPQCRSSSCEYTLPEELKLNSYALSGTWRTGGENIALEEGKGTIAIRFSANKVNLVANGTDGPVEAEIYLDGELVSTDKAGAEVKDGTVSFEAPELYNLIDLHGAYGEHLLEIRVKGPGLSAFAFTFG